VREFGLSPRENRRGMVSYSDDTITRALENYRRGQMAYTNEDFEKFYSEKRSQFVGYRSRFKESASKNKRD